MVRLDNGGRARDDVQILAPPDDLRGLVEHVWIQPHSDGSHDWRVVPDASAHLIAPVVESSRGRHLRVRLVGPRSRAAAIDLRGRILTVGVRFRPGALSTLVCHPAVEFKDRSLAIGDVLSSGVMDGLELSPDAPPLLLAGEMVRIVRRGARRSTAGPLADAIRKVSRVRGVTEALAVPGRTLRDRAQREIGLSPKRCLRILRLHRALMLASKGNHTWVDIAQMAGYADQAHFTRECRSLLGETPSCWSKRRSAGASWNA
jgi:AraC-like DNA-binding protein